jgi:hypothetical protein
MLPLKPPTLRAPSERLRAGALLLIVLAMVAGSSMPSAHRALLGHTVSLAGGPT